MISRYPDHAAIERTNLAWVRTAIAVMAFGFLVEKLDLFLQVAARSRGGRAPTAAYEAVGGVSALLLIVLGTSMMAVATIRFRKVGRDIDAEEPRPGRGTRMDMVLVGLLLGLGTTLFAYLACTVAGRLL
jgi:putative membrane protein